MDTTSPPSGSTRLRVALIDDHLLFRQGLRAILAAQPGLEVVVEAASTEGLALDASRADVAIVDIMLRKTSGAAAVREIAQKAPPCRVLVLTAHADEALLAEAFAAGAAGLALKDQDASEVVAAVHAVAAGARYLPPALNGRPVPLVPQVPQAPQAQPARPIAVRRLSVREREIFDLIVAGCSNREIAERLQISVKTVEAHRVNINRKLDAHSTADLVRLAARHGLMVDSGIREREVFEPKPRTRGVA
jgi:two-component system response regulator NreC